MQADPVMAGWYQLLQFCVLQGTFLWVCCWEMEIIAIGRIGDV